ncbi:MAG: peptidylprolyl isomerase [Verrucomicrobiaceae bacterium]|nr:peptidylprolyl isomerase [Verrucomicrobiaceae bacterium]
MSDLVIAADSRVTLHFSLKLENGDTVDSTFDKAPATFTVGDGSLLPGFERKLFGLRKGARAQFNVLPEDAFGQPNPNNVQRFKRDQFDPALELHKGLIISFADASKAELPGVISEFDAQQVVVDFNHPLAGHTIAFDVEIINVEVSDTVKS